MTSFRYNGIYPIKRAVLLFFIYFGKQLLTNGKACAIMNTERK